MKEVVIIGLAVVGIMTLGFDFFLLEHFVEEVLTEARRDLWVMAGVIYLILLAPPFFMSDMERREKAGDVLKVGGFALLDVAQIIGLGFLIYIGWYLATTVFSS